MNMVRIKQLGDEFDAQVSLEDRGVKILNDMVEEYGYEATALASGYKVSSLITLLRGDRPIPQQRIERAQYVFRNLTVE